MELLKKAFIKDYKNTGSPEVRVRYGVTAGIIGLLINLLLFGLKLTVGLISGSVTIIADAVNNLSDAGSSVVTLIGFRLAGKPADKEHPFGHARYEYITGLIVSFVVLAIGLMLGKSSVEKILSPEEVTADIYTAVVLVIAICGKIFQMLMYRSFGQSVHSLALEACAQDSRNDIISTSVVLAATMIMSVTGVMIDGYAGLLISVFIVAGSVKLLRETMNPLLGEKPDKALVDRIKSALLSYEGVLGIHDMMIHTYGEGRTYVMVHVEVSASDSIVKSHELIDGIERDFREKQGIIMSIHMDPVEKDNPLLNRLEPRIVSEIKKLNDRLSVHDFRVVSGESRVSVLFDVEAPYGEKVSLSVLENTAKVVAEGIYPDLEFDFIINIENSYV